MHVSVTEISSNHWLVFLSWFYRPILIVYTLREYYWKLNLFYARNRPKSVWNWNLKARNYPPSPNQPIKPTSRKWDVLFRFCSEPTSCQKQLWRRLVIVCHCQIVVFFLNHETSLCSISLLTSSYDVPNKQQPQYTVPPIEVIIMKILVSIRNYLVALRCNYTGSLAQRMELVGSVQRVYEYKCSVTTLCGMGHEYLHQRAWGTIGQSGIPVVWWRQAGRWALLWSLRALLLGSSSARRLHDRWNVLHF